MKRETIKTILSVGLTIFAVIAFTVFVLFIAGSDKDSADEQSSICETTCFDELETTETEITTTTTEKTTTTTTTETTTTESTTTETITTESTTVKETTTNSPTTTTFTTSTTVTTTSTTPSTTSTTLTESTPQSSTETSAVTAKATESVSTSVTTKDIETVAREVWSGLWGANEERKERLEAAGYNYLEVQSMVNVLKSEHQSAQTETGMTFVKTFSRGTYYCYGGSRRGGSGRTLVNCAYGDGTVKGSIASSYLYRNYGYNYNGSRTTVYLEVNGYSGMNGYYYVDDSDAGNSNVIDFFYYYGSECPFRNQGVVSVNCYIVN